MDFESAPPAMESTKGLAPVMKPAKGQEEEEVDEALRAAPVMLVVRPKKASQGKQRIEICYIENRERRQVTFSKRRYGLFKKASELVQLCGARVALIVFSERSKPFAIGSPSVDAVLREYAPVDEEDEVASWLRPDVEEEDAAGCRDAVEAALRQAEETKAQVVAEQVRMEAIGRKVREAMGDKEHWWDADVEKLGPEELPEFARALQRLMDNLKRHVAKLSPAADPAQHELPEFARALQGQ